MEWNITRTVSIKILYFHYYVWNINFLQIIFLGAIKYWSSLMILVTNKQIAKKMMLEDKVKTSYMLKGFIIVNS